METGREFLDAIRDSTKGAWDEWGEGAGEFIDKLITFVHEKCDARGLKGRQRTAIIYLEGMLRATQIRWRQRSKDIQKVADRMGISVDTGEPKVRAR